jgi:4-hydroxy-2-oxoheptanedioate aldolase
MNVRPSTIKAKLSQGASALCTSLHLMDASLYELTSLLGFDGIWMDLEHHGCSVETAGQMMRAARVGGTDIVARPAKGEFMRMGRLLEQGAQAIMYPRCDGPEEAAEVVSWSKFAPLGRRGFDGGNADALYTCVPMPEYIEHANRETLVIIQLEHQQAIDQAEAIAAVPGVDVLMLGPADYSILSGFPGEFSHPRVVETMQVISRAAHQAGKHWACTTGGTEQARIALDLGARLLFCGADIVMVRRGLEELKSQFTGLGFTFDNRTQPRRRNE